MNNQAGVENRAGNNQDDPMGHAIVPIHLLLPPGPNGEDGSQVSHRFKADKIYCVQTIQWACGVPVGWGTCYKSEGVSQV